ncbi:hypothetical protein LTR91_010955 [Friedmanniomyces endolithicus]|uniref:Uncharacterized protein n=1 Tax=Friedmanniomyces endolithicus TaxID=329885 RepID=A0AAN6KIH5_9PEZI|nr:hypothetical protein LTR94_006648 [Friedmanniomyces endolithicus]KAK0781800.1 hypothetical protein LTR59_012363 [Friedmanniomyces endolithicus]KAK0792690.1 hypothetical protein LTR75_011395 [Friedmanniomyces endolithicus]KAK0801808.1 hypothetical protein LTR38_006660 [Friedmanniomyces endolithicus]KAK0856425.1 hypothetical protein LTS02_010624 [Friedmanniomyces endolithicus]
MTPWVLHDANYSFGRGTYYLDSAGNPTTIQIMAGTEMKSGFKTTLPTNIEADLDFTDITVQVESWKANPMRYHWPVEVYHELFARFKAIAPEKTGVYEAVKCQKAYSTFPADLDEADEILDDAADIVDDGDDSHEAALAARISPAAEDMIVLTEVLEDGDGCE